MAEQEASKANHWSKQFTCSWDPGRASFRIRTLWRLLRMFTTIMRSEELLWLPVVNIARSASKSQLDTSVVYVLLSASYWNTMLSFFTKHYWSLTKEDTRRPQTSWYARIIFGWRGINIAEDSRCWSYNLMDFRSVRKREYIFTANVLRRDCPRNSKLRKGKTLGYRPRIGSFLYA